MVRHECTMERSTGLTRLKSGEYRIAVPETNPRKQPGTIEPNRHVSIICKATYDAKVIAFREVAASKSDLTALFMNFDADAIYAAGPQGVAELEFLGSLGLQFANADSPESGAFWETLSTEAALKYPSDVLYNDVYSTYQTLEELQEQPVLDAMPAVATGQVGAWKRDFPVSYAGLTDFLEVILATLRTAEKVTD